jgi:hypothetical protein
MYKQSLVFAFLACAIGSASASQYVIDDGTVESALGVSGSDPFQILWTNSFVIEAGCETITGIDIMLGVNSNVLSNGRPLTLFIGSDANQDGILDQGGVLSQLFSTVQGASTHTFVTYDLSDVTFNVGDGFVVGAVWASTSTERFVADLDRTAPHFARRSYFGIELGGTIDPNDINAIGFQNFVENIGVDGNFMLRANCGPVPEPATVVALAMGSLAVLRRRVKKSHNAA